jgi:N-succinyldiaminopimelate aminotransferase
MPLEQLQRLVELAERFDFVIAADECYAEIYLDERDPPPACCRPAPRWAMGLPPLRGLP